MLKTTFPGMFLLKVFLSMFRRMFMEYFQAYTQNSFAKLVPKNVPGVFPSKFHCWIVSPRDFTWVSQYVAAHVMIATASLCKLVAYTMY